MRHLSILFVRLKALRVAAIIALGTAACAGLTACAANDEPAAMSGSSTPRNARSAWMDTPNESNWQDPLYIAH
jgi:hypothetical protein